jgi:drug/metabolite transporter (DMT)-like permease
MTWFTFSIFSIFALAAAELTQQHLLNKKNAFSERTSAVLTFLIQSVIAMPFLFMLGISDQLFYIFDQAIFPRVLFVTLIASIGMVFYLKSFRVRNISISAIFVSFSVIVSTLFGIAFFSESMSYLKFLGTSLVLVAIVVVNYKNTILEKNHFYGLVAGFIFGICYTLDKSIVTSNIHPLVYIFWAFFMVALWGFVLGGRDVVNSIKGKKLCAYWPIIISSVGYFLFNFFTFTAYQFGGEVGRVDAINNAQIFLIILFEFFVLKHTEGIIRKLFSAGLAIGGILILGMVK